MLSAETMKERIVTEILNLEFERYENDLEYITFQNAVVQQQKMLFGIMQGDGDWKDIDQLIKSELLVHINMFCAMNDLEGLENCENMSINELIKTYLDLEEYVNQQ